MPAGPAPHEPTHETRQIVQLHAAIGTPQAAIADILDISEKTLRKYYRRELDLALAEANAQIGGTLFKKAKGGDTAAMIFWMKTRAQWRETNHHEHTGADGGPIEVNINADAAEAKRRLLGKIANDTSDGLDQ